MPGNCESRDDTALDTLIRKENVSIVVRCLELIPRACRDLLRLRFWEEKSHGEIADILGIREVTSRVRLKRCLEQLEGQIKKLQSMKQFGGKKDYILGSQHGELT